MPKGEVNKAKHHCPKGHPYDEENTYHSAGRRHCRACSKKYQREYKRMIRARARSLEVC